MLIQDLFFEAHLWGRILAGGIVNRLFMFFFGRTLEFANKKRLFYCCSRRRAHFLRFQQLGLFCTALEPWIPIIFEFFPCSHYLLYRLSARLRFLARSTCFLGLSIPFTWGLGGRPAYGCLWGLGKLCLESCNRSKCQKLKRWSLEFIGVTLICEFGNDASWMQSVIISKFRWILSKLGSLDALIT